MTTSNYVGPLSFAVFAVPADAELVSVIAELQTLQLSHAVEVLDLELVERSDDGTVRRLTFADETAAAAETDLLDDDDLSEIGRELRAGERALVVVYEDRSLATVADRITALGGREAWAGGIDAADLDEGVAS